MRNTIMLLSFMGILCSCSITPSVPDDSVFNSKAIACELEEYIKEVGDIRPIDRPTVVSVKIGKYGPDTTVSFSTECRDYQTYSLNDDSLSVLVTANGLFRCKGRLCELVLVNFDELPGIVNKNVLFHDCEEYEIIKHFNAFINYADWKNHIYKSERNYTVHGLDSLFLDSVTEGYHENSPHLDFADYEYPHNYRFDNCGFRFGLSKIQRNTGWGFSNRQGRVVVPCVYDFVWSFSEGCASVRKGDKYSFIDKSGKEIVPFEYDLILPFSCGLSVFEKERKWGVIDKEGNIIVSPDYDYIYPFREGLAKVKIGSKYGFINRRGKLVIPLIYDEITQFKNGRAKYLDSGLCKLINRRGREIGNR